MSEGFGYMVLFFVLSAPLVFVLYRWLTEEVKKREE